MPLLQFWKTAKEEVLKMTIEQVVASAGNGVLHDHSPCSDEFRQYLIVAPIERLFDYSRHCLESSFNKSGLALQDIVNEFGRRLDFEVENGLYQGKRNAIGYDGIWKAKGESYAPQPRVGQSKELKTHGDNFRRLWWTSSIW
jgi:hypothetical protein